MAVPFYTLNCCVPLSSCASIMLLMTVQTCSQLFIMRSMCLLDAEKERREEDEG